LVALLCTCCSEPAETPGTEPEPGAPAAAGGPQPERGTSLPDQTLPPAEYLAALLASIHGPLPEALLRSRWRVVQGDVETGVSLWAPGRLRVDLPTGGYLLAREDAAYRVTPSTDGGLAATPLANGEAAGLLALRDAFAAVALEPLYRAEGATRTDDGAIQFSARGARWTLRLDDRGLPAVLTSERTPPVDIGFLEWVAPTRRTWVPSRVRLGALGQRSLSVDSAAVRFADDYFEPPTAALPAPEVRQLGGEDRPAEPVLTTRAATRWLVHSDPGTWAERQRVFWDAGWPIHNAGATLDGFAWLLDDAEPKLAIPFRDKQGDEATTPELRDGWTLVERPEGRALVVYPALGGSLASRIDAARSGLREFSKTHGLTLAGPMRSAPYVHLHEKRTIDAELLANRHIRVEWDLAPR